MAEAHLFDLLADVLELDFGVFGLQNDNHGKPQARDDFGRVDICANAHFATRAKRNCNVPGERTRLNSLPDFFTEVVILLQDSRRLGQTGNVRAYNAELAGIVGSHLMSSAN